MDESDSVQQIVVHQDQIAANEASYRNDNNRSSPRQRLSGGIWSAVKSWLDKFKPAPRPITLYERALLDCDEFDISWDDPKLNTFDAFYKNASESSSIETVQVEHDAGVEKRATYERAYQAYYADPKGTRRQLVNVFSEITLTGTSGWFQFAATTASVATVTIVGARYLLKSSYKCVSGMLGLLSGFLVSHQYVGPLIQQVMLKKNSIKRHLQPPSQAVELLRYACSIPHCLVKKGLNPPNPANPPANPASLLITLLMALAGFFLGFMGGRVGQIFGLLSGIFISYKFLSPLIQRIFGSSNMVEQLQEAGYFDEPNFSNQQTSDEMDKEYSKALDMLNACRTTPARLIKRIRKNYLQSLSLQNIKGDPDSIQHFLQLEKAYRTVKAYRMHRNEWN